MFTFLDVKCNFGFTSMLLLFVFQCCCLVWETQCYSLCVRDVCKNSQVGIALSFLLIPFSIVMKDRVL